MNAKYPLFKVHVPKTALAHLNVVLQSGYINEGSQVTELTQKLSQFLFAHNLCLLNSCTSALTLALHLAGVKAGDEVVSTPMTCIATNTPIVNAGAKLVWADIDPETAMVTVDSVKSVMTKKTKAVVVVAWAGSPPELDKLQSLCKERNVKLVLDAAHAFGAAYKDKPIHDWADFTAYSFQAIKHFTTGDGGALVCSSDQDFKRAKALKWFGLDRDKAKDAKGDWKGQQWDVDVHEAGFKYNMNNVSAAIGLSQLPHAEHILAKHQCNASLYDEHFDGSKTVFPLKQHDGAVSTHWVYTVLLEEGTTKEKRDDVLKQLNDHGVMAGVVHVPNDAYTAFASSKRNLPGVREFEARQLSLPCGWWLNEDDVKHIADVVKSVVG